MELESLKRELKQLVIVECDKEGEMQWEDIQDDEPLFSSESKVGLDSLDALQLSLALKKKFGIRIEGSKESRKNLHSIQAIADFISSKLAN